MLLTLKNRQKYFCAWCLFSSKWLQYVIFLFLLKLWELGLESLLACGDLEILLFSPASCLSRFEHFFLILPFLQDVGKTFQVAFSAKVFLHSELLVLQLSIANCPLIKYFSLPNWETFGITLSLRVYLKSPSVSRSLPNVERRCFLASMLKYPGECLPVTPGDATKSYLKRAAVVDSYWRRYSQISSCRIFVSQANLLLKMIFMYCLKAKKLKFTKGFIIYFGLVAMITTQILWKN